MDCIKNISVTTVERYSRPPQFLPMTLLLPGAHKIRAEADFSLDSEPRGANSLSPTAAAPAPTPSNDNYPGIHSELSLVY